MSASGGPGTVPGPDPGGTRGVSPLNPVSRRDFLKLGAAAGALSLGAAAGIARLAGGAEPGRPASEGETGPAAAALHGGRPRPDYPQRYLTHFDWGKVVEDRSDGSKVREYDVVAVDQEIEIAEGMFYPAWTYRSGDAERGAVPGPTLRATEGDRLRIRFRNDGSKPHSMHFHGFHPSNMDGTFQGIAKPGQSFTYEFDADPFGLHLYHCHVMPLRMHIARGMYGAYIVDPKPERLAEVERKGGQRAKKVRELVMMMNGFDTDFDGENDFYTVNGFVNYYTGEHRIRLKKGELVRIYLVNMTEFDLVNSLHTHATFFHTYRTGTMLEPDGFTDTIMLCQGERAIIELKYDHPGEFMFHAHQSEFAELGWLGVFEVKP